MQERLLEIGEWLAVNGEGIYSTRKWRVQQNAGLDNSTMRYTQSKDGSNIYVHLLGYPSQNTVVVTAPKPSDSATVGMLGYNGLLMWKPAVGGGITVQLPAFSPTNTPCNYIWVLRLTGFT